MSIVEPFADQPEAAAAPPSERTRAARRSTLVSVGVNLVLGVAQVGTGLWSHSQALVSDGVHSLSDLVADFVVLFASHQSQKDADADHPYGHQRFETGASLVLGLLLLMVASAMLWTALGKLQHPEAIPRVHALALGIAALTLVAKETLFRYMLAAAKRVKSGMLVANAWHARSDAASSLVVGLGVGGNLLGHTLLDPIAASIVGFLVGRMGWGFAWNALQDMMDRGLGSAEVDALAATLRTTPGVQGVHDLRTRKMGDMILVDAHIEVNADLTVEAGHAIAVAARQRAIDRHRVLDVMVHIDPWRRPDGDHTPLRSPV